MNPQPPTEDETMSKVDDEIETRAARDWLLSRGYKIPTEGSDRQVAWAHVRIASALRGAAMQIQHALEVAAERPGAVAKEVVGKARLARIRAVWASVPNAGKALDRLETSKLDPLLAAIKITTEKAPGSTDRIYRDRYGNEVRDGSGLLLGVYELLGMTADHDDLRQWAEKHLATKAD